jgi:hypothetical protein
MSAFSNATEHAQALDSECLESARKAIESRRGRDVFFDEVQCVDSIWAWLLDDQLDRCFFELPRWLIEMRESCHDARIATWEDDGGFCVNG